MNLGLFKTSHFGLGPSSGPNIQRYFSRENTYISEKHRCRFLYILSQVSLEKVKKQKKIQRNLKYSAFTMLTFEILILIYKLF